MQSKSDVNCCEQFKRCRSSHRRCSIKKVFLEISQNLQENTCARVSFLIKLQAWPTTLLKKRLWQRCFPVNFVKFLRRPFFTEHLRWLLLKTLLRIFEQTNFFISIMLTVKFSMSITKEKEEPHNCTQYVITFVYFYLVQLKFSSLETRIVL